MAIPVQTLIDRSVKNMGTGINSRVREYAIELIKRAYKEGIYVQITSGYRSNAEQTKLYNQGRTTKGNIVTNAKAGQSIHNYGLAIDYVLVSEDGNQAIWVVNDKWKRVAAIGKSMGFQWGGDWKSFRDYPHLDMQKGISLSQLAAGKRPTIPALSATTPTPVASTSSTEARDYLIYDDRNEDVTALQKYLTQVGFPVKINGHYSAETKKAVMNFQASRGLKDDGVYGKESKAEMNVALKEKKEPISTVKPASSTKPKKDVVRMFKPSKEVLNQELIQLLDKAKADKIISSDEWKELAKKGQLPLDDAVGLIASYLNRTHK